MFEIQNRTQVEAGAAATFPFSQYFTKWVMTQAEIMSNMIFNTTCLTLTTVFCFGILMNKRGMCHKSCFIQWLMKVKGLWSAVSGQANCKRPESAG